MSMGNKLYFSMVWDIGDWDSRAIRYYNSIPRIQRQIRYGIWEYLCRHFEIRAIIRVILHHAVSSKPNPDNIRKFLADFFNPLLVPMLRVLPTPFRTYVVSNHST